MIPPLSIFLPKERRERWVSDQVDGIQYLRNPIFDILILQEKEIEEILKPRVAFPRKGYLWSDFLGEEYYWHRSFDSIPDFQKYRDRMFGFMDAQIWNMIRDQLDEYLKEIRHRFKYYGSEFFKIVAIKPLDESALRNLKRKDDRLPTGDQNEPNIHS